ncbi:MAG: 23S rRNA (adenine(1618)-N(6))-methyltransferase RlmF [Colwellia sp.]|nr:MAG: 23S rRNA (adenine(1618)-N(6))-methyltransferase RlmF [Colwellia sp.]
MDAKKTIIKNNLHKKNIHRHGYDFNALVKTHATLKAFVINNPYNQQSTIDFSNADAVKALNVALLKKYYQIIRWDFPQGYLCPPIPGRADYIHYLSDLLSGTQIEQKRKVTVLDIGTGASCIYPILGARAYGWYFVASDIDTLSIKTAKINVAANKNIAKHISCRLQNNSADIFHGIIQPNEYYHLTMCNPPFHKSLADANTGTTRKWKNLHQSSKNAKSDKQNALNFGGQKAELWCQGGELSFIGKMIRESVHYQNQVLWFTCLVSKKDHLSKLKLYLKKAQVKEVKIINMAQGQKISRFIAWRFTQKPS